MICEIEAEIGELPNENSRAKPTFTWLFLDVTERYMCRIASAVSDVNLGLELRSGTAGKRHEVHVEKLTAI